MRGVQFVLVAVLASPATAGEDTSYVWPLDLPRVLTSSFAEYRDHGFHMGIDLRTGGVGRDVRAAADGHAVRLRSSPKGYGKAVYLRLADGNTVIYAHLSDFAPALAQYVRAQQHAAERYEVDLYPEPGMFPVKAGEVIGKSGQTGIGAPHLHFEVRDETGSPISPESLGLSWPDRSAPLIRKVLVMPATPWTRINGDLVPVILKARREKSGEYVCDGFEFDGSVAFAVDAVDRDSAPSTRLGVREVHTYAGDQEIFRLRHERVSYSNYRDGAVAYHPYFLDSGRFLVQWRWPGNDVESYRRSPNNGLLYSAASRSEVKMDITDFQDNTSVITVPVKSHREVDTPLPSIQTAQAGTVTYDTYGNWLTVSVGFDGSEVLSPTLVVGPAGRQMPFRRISDGTFRVNYMPPSDAETVVVDVRHPRVRSTPTSFLVAWRGARRRAETIENLAIRIESQSPYGVLFLRVTREAVAATTGELRPAGEGYQLWHPSTPVDEAIGLGFPVRDGIEDPSGLAVYRKNGRSAWEYLGGELREGRLWVSTNKFGFFSVMWDRVPPSIVRVRPSGKGQLSSARPRIRATVRDAGSGIVGYSIRANGDWLLSEYDPERQILAWVRDEDLPEGLVSLDFSLTDAAGNVARHGISVQVPRNDD